MTDFGGLGGVPGGRERNTDDLFEAAVDRAMGEALQRACLVRRHGVADLEREIAALTAQLTEAQRHLRATSDVLESVKMAMVGDRCTTEGITDAVRRVRRERDDLRAQLEVADERLANWEPGIIALAEYLSGRPEARADATVLGEALRLLRAADERAERLERQLEDEREDLSERSCTLDDVRVELKAANALCRAQLEALDKAHADHAAAQLRVSELERERNDLVAYASQLADVERAAREWAKAFLERWDDTGSSADRRERLLNTSDALVEAVHALSALASAPPDAELTAPPLPEAPAHAQALSASEIREALEQGQRDFEQSMRPLSAGAAGTSVTERAPDAGSRVGSTGRCKNCMSRSCGALGGCTDPAQKWPPQPLAAPPPAHTDAERAPDAERWEGLQRSVHLAWHRWNKNEILADTALGHVWSAFKRAGVMLDAAAPPPARADEPTTPANPLNDYCSTCYDGGPDDPHCNGASEGCRCACRRDARADEPRGPDEASPLPWRLGENKLGQSVIFDAAGDVVAGGNLFPRDAAHIVSRANAPDAAGLVGELRELGEAWRKMGRLDFKHCADELAAIIARAGRQA